MALDSVKAIWVVQVVWQYVLRGLNFYVNSTINVGHFSPASLHLADSSILNCTQELYYNIILQILIEFEYLPNM